MRDTAQRKVACYTVGCRLNQYETEKMAAELAPFGFARAGDDESADLFIINTCTVTHRADSNCRNYIRRIARKNPDAKIVVAGCYVEYDRQAVQELYGVDAVINNAEKSEIGRILPDKFPDLFDKEPDAACSTFVTDFFEHNRAWLKISDGCNQDCTFCIIPTVRGRMAHRPAYEIINDINKLTQHGYCEIVFTGVNFGYYHDRKGKLPTKNLAELCRHIFAKTDIYRLRLSSIESQTIGDDLIQAYVDANGRICSHWHVPLQSGSSRVLKEMKRPYDRSEWIKRVEAIKAAAPGATIGADVIVGFPGETDEDFDQTRSVAESGLIDYLHVFSYSDRTGTPSSKKTNKVSPQIIRDRAKALTALSDQLKAERYQRQVGRVLEVIPQHRRDSEGCLSGIAGNYTKVKLPQAVESGRSIIKIAIKSACDDYVTGELVAS